MYRILLILVTVIVVGLAVGYGLRTSHKTSNAVTSLLPRETVVLMHLPDLARTRDDWRHSDIYQLYNEPSVRDFLGKPLGLLPGRQSVAQTGSDLQTLDPKDLFLAVTSASDDKSKLVAGFRFRDSPEEAEKTIGPWRRNLLGTSAASQPEEQEYQQHKIQIYRVASGTVGTVYTGHWFFAATDLEELKRLVDRAEGRGTPDGPELLSADKNFREAMAQMPASYALCFYLQPKTLAQKLTALRLSAGQGANLTPPLLKQIRSICAATRFDGGKLHDFFFVGMPEQTAKAAFTRSSLALAGTDTFIYTASLLDLPRQFSLVDPLPAAGFLGSRLQRIGQGLAAAGITADQWDAVFGSEVGAVADWRSDSHWPATLVAFPVKDFDRAKKIADRLARILDDDGAWVESDKNGIHYISTPYSVGFLTLHPTIAVSDRFMVAGLDTASVASAMERAGGGSLDLASSAAYKRAAQMLPEPSNMFAYVDLGLLYTRLDAALRPMLLMSSAFMPAMNDYVDMSKLPSAEIVAKHLSPIVSSQRYQNNGYVAESIGPVTLSQTGIGVLLIAGAGAFTYQHAGLGALNGGGLGLPIPGMFIPSTSPNRVWSGKAAGSPTPEPTPEPLATP